MASIKGVELSRRFYGELVGPWLGRDFPRLRHAAALIGYGSELLGFDDAMSQDHNWGPRVLLFISQADFDADAERIVAGFTEAAPPVFLGAPIDLAARSLPPPRGPGALGDPRHGLEVWTLESFLRERLAIDVGEPRDNLAWLGLAEQSLLTVTAGAVFHDDDGRLTAIRTQLATFPRDVRLYKLACQWRRIGEEQAFVGRTGLTGDELGSRVIAARLARDAMRMAFLIEGRYAPYPKWFGAAFAQLPCAPDLASLLDRVLAAPDWKRREAALAETYLMLARLHRARGLPGAFEAVVGPYFDRPFTVINAQAIGEAIRAEIEDPALRAAPLIGALDQVTDSTAVLEAPERARRAVDALFDDGQARPLEET